MSILIDNVEVGGRAERSVLVADGVVREVGPGDVVGRAARPDRVIDGGGGLLLPGLHDHHLHLFALATKAMELWCGAPDVNRADDLVDRLRETARARRDRDWLTGGGWDDTVIGWPDRHDLDHAVADRPIRLRHRSGSNWLLNSAALARLDLDLEASVPPGFERDRNGSLTGRVFGEDDWLGERLGGGVHDLTEVGRGLALCGITAVTEATPHAGSRRLDTLARQCADGRFPQRVQAMTAPGVDVPSGIESGPVKIALIDRSLPERDGIVQTIVEAHAHKRAVSIDATTPGTLEFALSVLAEAGPRAVDRIDHATVVPPEMIRPLARLGVAVVTRYDDLTESGERYHQALPARQRRWLHPGRTLLDAGIPLALGSDAPNGRPDPFAGLHAAVHRTMPDGRVHAPHEVLEPEEALGLLLGPIERPGGRPRRIRAGGPADLCLLDRPWAAVRDRPDRRMVRATLIAGNVVHERAPT